MSNRPRIVLCTSTGFPAAQVAEIQAAADGVEIDAVADTRDAIWKAIPGASALIGCPRMIFSDALLAAAGPSLRWMHASGAGCEEFITPGLQAHTLVLTNGRIIQGPEVADHAVALLLAIARNIHAALRGRPAKPSRPIELRGKTAAVVGLGGAGLLAAERLHAFGMRVVGVNPQPLPMLSLLDDVVPPDRLREVLPGADAVLMAAPHTPQTDKLFGAAEFALMKPTAIFVNVSRGKTVDTDALTAAVKQGRPGSAGIDVTDPEPLPPDHPLRHMDNVIVTEHQAGLSDHNRRRSFELIKINVARFAAGVPLLNIVDKQLGY